MSDHSLIQLWLILQLQCLRQTYSKVTENKSRYSVRLVWHRGASAKSRHTRRDGLHHRCAVQKKRRSNMTASRSIHAIRKFYQLTMMIGGSSSDAHLSIVMTSVLLSALHSTVLGYPFSSRFVTIKTVLPASSSSFSAVTSQPT